MLGLLFENSIEVTANHVGEFGVHMAIFDHLFGFPDRFAQEHFGFCPVFPFFVDQAETIEAVGVIGLCEHELLEGVFGCIEISGLDGIESLIPPFDIIFLLERADVRILRSAQLNVV